MTIRTQIKFSDALDQDFSWRIREIDQIKKTVRTSLGLATNALVRAGVPLLYAHWEGFVKCGAENFLNFVRHQDKKYCELQTCFMLHGISTEIEILTESSKQHKRIASLEFLKQATNKKAKFNWKNRIKTNSNLNSEVFESIATSIGIDPSPYLTRKNWIDVTLLSARNKIAHGEWLAHDSSNFESLANDTIALMRQFKTDLENSCAMKTYLRKIPA